MSLSLVIIIWAILGIMGAIVGYVFAYRTKRIELNFLSLRVKQAELDLIQDIEGVGKTELSLTRPGRELLILEGVNIQDLKDLRQIAASDVNMANLENRDQQNSSAEAKPQSTSLEKEIENLNSLSIGEAARLTKLLEEKWGVSAARADMLTAMGTQGAEPVEEKIEFDVILKEAGPKKTEVIKVIRQLTNLGLVEAKNISETTEGKILSAVDKDVAANAKSKLEAVGAHVEIE